MEKISENKPAMTNKLEKIIKTSFLIQILLGLYFYFKIFQNYANMFDYPLLSIPLLFLPIFLVFIFLYKKKYKISKMVCVNQKTRFLKIISLILFFVVFSLLFIIANKINPDYQNKYLANVYEINLPFVILRDLFSLLWPIFSIIFAIDFFKKENVNLRYQNLKDATWSMFIFSFLFSFAKTFAMVLFDIEVVLFYMFK